MKSKTPFIKIRRKKLFKFWEEKNQNPLGSKGGGNASSGEYISGHFENIKEHFLLIYFSLLLIILP